MPLQGKLPSGDHPRLHVTSEHWDVEECLILIGQRTHALSVHGTARSGKVVYIGGLDTATGAALATALRAAGFTVVQPAPADIAGTSVGPMVAAVAGQAAAAPVADTEKGDRYEPLTAGSSPVRALTADGDQLSKGKSFSNGPHVIPID